MVKWDPNSISRGTKCFGARSSSLYPGSFPTGFMKWIQKMGWWGNKRIHLCAGAVDDEEADRVDVQRVCRPNKARKAGNEFATTANIIADGRDVPRPDESYDCVIIDPPYSKELAHALYNTKKEFGGIDAFAREGWRLVRPGGLVVCFSYAVAKRPAKNAELIAHWGIYQVPSVRWMTSLSVWQKPNKGDRGWIEVEE